MKRKQKQGAVNTVNIYIPNNKRGLSHLSTIKSGHISEKAGYLFIT
jgi:hypothetical protein